MQDSGSLAVFKVTARDQGHYKGPWGAFVTYCNISCLFLFLITRKLKQDDLAAAFSTTLLTEPLKWACQNQPEFVCGNSEVFFILFKYSFH